MYTPIVSPKVLIEKSVHYKRVHMVVGVKELALVGLEPGSSYMEDECRSTEQNTSSIVPSH